MRTLTAVLPAAIAAFFVAGATDGEAAEVLLTQPTLSGMPIGRCLRDGRDRCTAGALDYVANQVCSALGFERAVSESVTDDVGEPRAVAILDSRTRLFVEGTDSRTIASLRCLTPEPVITLTKPANGAQVDADLPEAGQPQNFMPGDIAASLAWTTRNLATSHVVIGCVQRSDRFDNDRYQCRAPVVSWSGNHRMTAYPLAFSQIAGESGRRLFWSVRACEPSPNGPVEANGTRYSCTDWVPPRRLSIRAPAHGAAADALNRDAGSRPRLDEHFQIQANSRQAVCLACFFRRKRCSPSV